MAFLRESDSGAAQRAAPPSPPDPAVLRRDLRSLVGDGVAFSAMVGIGEAYLPAFALAAGHGELVAGLVTTLPMLAGAVFQLASPAGSRWLGSYRRWVVWCARLQALSFAPLVAGALLGRIRLEWLFLAAAAYWAFGMATSPAWNAWVDALVPIERRARFFAQRSRWAQASLLLALLAGGAILERGQGPIGPVAVFAVLFGVAAGARLISAAYLAAQSEPAGLARSHRRLSPRGVVARLRGTGPGHLLLFLLANQAAVNVAAPFFTPYMLEELALSYGEFTALTAAAFAARIAILPLWGHVAHTRGTRAILWIGAVGVVPLPALWLVSPSFAYLFALQCFAGAMWAAFELATLLSFFERIEGAQRASVLTLFNLGSALAVTGGSLLGGFLFGRLDAAAGGYMLIFACSSAARVVALPLLRQAELSERLPGAGALRTLAVRPSIGAVQSPILPSLDTAGEAEAAADTGGDVETRQRAGRVASPQK